MTKKLFLEYSHKEECWDHFLNEAQKRRYLKLLVDQLDFTHAFE